MDTAYNFTGNVREMINLVVGGVVLSVLPSDDY